MQQIDENKGAELGAMPNTITGSYAHHSAVITAFDHFASRVTRWVGSPVAFGISFFVIVGWLALGPIFKFSSEWQLVINTVTTIITFLMVFLIQQSQNKDSVAIHLKLNELLASSKVASNRMIGIEELDEQDLREVAAFYVKLAECAKAGALKKKAHSIDEGESITVMTAKQDMQGI